MADTTVDLQQQLVETKANKTNDVSLTLAIVVNCTRKQRDGTVGTKVAVS